MHFLKHFLSAGDSSRVTFRGAVERYGPFNWFESCPGFMDLSKEVAVIIVSTFKDVTICGVENQDATRADGMTLSLR